MRRIFAIDILRGISILLMALDHFRGFFITSHFDPSDVSHTEPWLFLTRWITHFCAPVFILLAGISIYLTLSSNKKSLKEESFFLIKRGIWLIILECSLLSIFWHTNLDVIQLQIIWIIGISFLLMSMVIYMPWIISFLFSIVMITCHNLLDLLNLNGASSLIKVLMTCLHQPGVIPISNGFRIDILYTVLPWAGIMMLGFCMGSLYNFSIQRRRNILLISGALMILAYLILRSYNMYGEPSIWSTQSGNSVHSVMLFLNVTKYPASLHFILMTLGPSFILLALLDNASDTKMKSFRLLGQTAMFFYIIHIPIIRLTGKVYSTFIDHNPSILLFFVIFAFLVWILFFICRFYRNFKYSKKSNPRYWWLAYL